MVELDTQLSRDAVPFLLHDDLVDRTSNGQGVAAAMAYHELAVLDAGSWFAPKFAGEGMPTLAAVARRCQMLSLAVNLEIKPYPGTDSAAGAQIAREAARLWAGAQPPLLSSFSIQALEAAQLAMPDLPRSLLIDDVPHDWLAQARRLGCVALHANHRKLSRELVADVHLAGLWLMAYTVNEPARARELKQWGVDAVCTDNLTAIGAHFFDG
jgi:glycerophosphoryl diester phosphodiesterase